MPSYHSANEQTVFTQEDAVPSDEPDPKKRRGITIGPIEAADGETLPEVPDTAPRRPPANITEICATYPLGNGHHYVRVERLDPKTFQSHRTAGWQADLYQAFNEGQFREMFGGGKYGLTVYGPKEVQPDGVDAPIVKPLTKRIDVWMPGQPVIDPDVPEPPGYDRRMRGNGSRSMTDRERLWGPERRRQPTSADAAMHGQELSFAAKLLDKQEKREDQYRKELQDASSSGRDVGPMLETFMEMQRSAREDLRAELDKRDQQLRDERERGDRMEKEFKGELDKIRGDMTSKPSESSHAWDAISRITKGMSERGQLAEDERRRIFENNSEEIRRLHEKHTDELRRIHDQHERELSRAKEQHENEVRRLREERQEVERQLRDQLDSVRRDMKESHDVEKRDLEQRHKDAIEREAQRTAERMETQKNHYESRIDTLKDSQTLVSKTEKVTYDAKVSTLEDRIDMLKSELEQARAEAERKGNLAEQIAEAEQTASALGFVKGDDNAPKTWQERLAMMAGTALTNLPDILREAGQTMQARTSARQAEMQQAYLQAQAQERQLSQNAPGAANAGTVVRDPSGRPVAARRQVWGSDAGPVAMADQNSNETPAPQWEPPPAAPEQQRPQQPPQPPPQPPQPPPQPLQGQPQAPPPPAAEKPAEQPQPDPPAPQEPQEGGEARDVEAQVAAQFEPFRMHAELALAQGATPQHFVSELVKHLGPQAVRQSMESMNLDELLDVWASQRPNSPLLQQSGQAWLRGVWQEATAIVAPEAEQKS